MAINPATIIGDLLTHKGELIDVRLDTTPTLIKTTRLFNGWTNFLALLPTIGVDVTDTGSALLLTNTTPDTTSRDLWGTKTNLLYTSTTQRISAAMPITITHIQPVIERYVSSSDAFVRQIQKVTYQETISNTITDDTTGAQTLADVDRDWTNLQYDSTTSVSSISMHSATVATALACTWAGYAGDNTHGRVIATAMLTPWGLHIRTERRVSLATDSRVFSGGNQLVDFNDEDNNWVELDTVNKELVIRENIIFKGYGWPTSRLTAAFNSPRRPRLVANIPTESVCIYSDPVSCTNRSKHPNVTEETQGEFDTTERVSPGAEELGGAHLMALGEPVLPHADRDFPVWSEADCLSEYLDVALSYTDKRDGWLARTPETNRMIRAWGLREHYNALANDINASTKIKQRTFVDFDWLVFNQDTTAYIGTFKFEPNTIGPRTGSFRPANHYRTFTAGDTAHHLARQLGIPIKTEADLPASYHTVKDVTEVGQLLIETAFTQTYEYISTRTEAGPTYYDTYRNSLSIGADTVTLNNSAGTFNMQTVFNGSTAGAEYLWCTVEDVQAAAEANGFKFLLERVVVPYILRVIELEDATRLFSNIQTSGMVGLDTIDSSDYEILRPFPPETFYAYWNPVITLPRRMARFFQVIEGETAEWIAESGATPKIQNHVEGDVFTAAGSLSITRYGSGQITQYAFLYHELEILNEVTWGSRFRRQEEALSRQWNSQTASLLHQHWCSTSLTRGSSAILIPISTWNHEVSTFSRVSFHKAKVRSENGSGLMPIQPRQPALAAATTILPLTTAQTLITPPAVADPETYAVILFQTWPS